MNVNRIKEAYNSLLTLLSEGGREQAIRSVLIEIGNAIRELEGRPQTYLHSETISLPSHWKSYHETLGYAEPPYFRTDGLTVCKYPDKNAYYAKYGNGMFVLDSKNRKKHWKYSLTAIAYLDKDIPVGS